MADKDRSSNPEVILINEIAAKILEGRYVGTYHREFKHLLPVKDPSGGHNWQVLDEAARLACGFDVSGSQSRFREAYDAATISPIPGISTGWMGTEQQSRIYGEYHYLGWMIAWRNGVSAARKWLEMFHLLLEASAAPDGRVMWVGQRSAVPGSGGPRWLDACLAVARGGSIERWRKGWGWPPTWQLLRHFAPQVREIHQGISEQLKIGGSDAMARGFKFRTPQWWLYSPSGDLMATWTDRTVNGQTPPMLAAVRVGDEIRWFPRNGGDTRERAGSGKPGDRANLDATIENGMLRLRYEATRSRPSPDEVEVAIPEGSRLVTLHEDGTVTESVIGAVDAPQPAEPPRPPTATSALRVTLEIRDGVTSVISTEPIL
jgi:hypothetical protein